MRTKVSVKHKVQTVKTARLWQKPFMYKNSLCILTIFNIFMLITMANTGHAVIFQMVFFLLWNFILTWVTGEKVKILGNYITKDMKIGHLTASFFNQR